ncbi:SUMF1/EgtB/PvdO family nonheme iron enzyme [Pseudomonas putida]
MLPGQRLWPVRCRGNVWELTRTGYRPGHDAQRDAKLDPSGPALSDSFDPADPGVPVAVIKGGSHLCSADRCMRYRPSARQPQPVFMTTSHVGFRTIRQ